jgi:glycosyltransferase involved in cell wall biosynthesis
MKIAFINYILAQNVVGVEKKIKQQAKCSPDSFHFYIVNRYTSKMDDGVHLLKIDKKYGYYDLFLRKFEIIENTVKLPDYNAVVVRYPYADKSGIKFTQKYNVISEHHSDEVSELKGNLFKSSSAATKLSSLIRLILEYRYGKHYRQICSGIVSVTDELKQKQLERAQKNLPSLTLPNGIDVESIRKTGFKLVSENRLDMIFVIGKWAPWHGLERLVESVQNYRGPFELNLHVVGDVPTAYVNQNRSDKIIFYGIKIGENLDNIFLSSNVAISTLGLHNKRMQEAASLKTREYAARGIPFILAYHDADLMNVEPAKKFFMVLPNTNTPIQFEKVIDFILELPSKHQSINELSGYMRKYALENMDWRPKMRRYYEFCEQLNS